MLPPDVLAPPIDDQVGSHTNQDSQPRRSARNRRPPAFFSDYVTHPLSGVEEQEEEEENATPRC